MKWIHRIIVAYLVATTMHVPFPVFDGDNLRSGEVRSHQSVSYSDRFDVDFILLGYDLPDDSDDGPVDDDPEDGSHSALGLPFSVTRTFSNSVLLSGLCYYAHAWNDCWNLVCIRTACSIDDLSFRDISFGKLCQNGIACLRC
ncbi:hypothetical protein Pla110_02230 [Polystyrenella longa]|uniref:Uncharacterized protein n=1 Tax=Polystyrenella longa TaxID=2528007 RepID=A0A518CH14_9PLAN|nr:hypothetical protein Pla110_02230 [Polystyrenella longa]